MQAVVLVGRCWSRWRGCAGVRVSIYGNADRAWRTYLKQLWVVVPTPRCGLVILLDRLIDNLQDTHWIAELMGRKHKTGHSLEELQRPLILVVNIEFHLCSILASKSIPRSLRTSAPSRSMMMY